METERSVAGALDSAAAGVLQRWNPDGTELLHRLRSADPARRTVALFSPAADLDALGRCVLAPAATALLTELARLEPQIDLVASPMEAVVVVALLDAGSVLGRAALTAIEELLRTDCRVVFTLTGVEAHRDWRTVRDRDAALLQRFAPDLCHAGDLRIWPVSARLSAIAHTMPAAAGSPELVLAGSGLRQLHAAIIESLPRNPLTDRDTHLARATATVIRATIATISAEAETLRADDPNLTALRSERTQLAARRDGGRGEIMAALRTQLQLGRVDLLHDTGVRVRAANAAARTEVDQLDRTRLPRFPQWLNNLVVATTAEVDRDIHERMADLAARIDPDSGPTGPTKPTAGGYSRAALSGRALIRTSAPDIGAGPRPRQRSIEDRVLIVLAASAGVGLGRMAVWPLSLIPALDIATMPVALLLGGGVGWWLTRSRQHLADRGHLRQWSTDTLVNVRAQLEQRVVAALVETESLLTEHVTRTSTDRMVEVDRRIAEISTMVRDIAARRSGRLASCERDLAVISGRSAGKM